MQARVPDDPGYFGERLNAAYAQLIHAWRQRVSHLSPDFRQTDIFGALELASQLYAQGPGAATKELVIFSDMRESTACADFKRAKLVPAYSLATRKCSEMAALGDVQVYVSGVDGAGKSALYWQSLHRFWTNYFQHAGATMEIFTVLTEMPHDR